MNKVAKILAVSCAIGVFGGLVALQDEPPVQRSHSDSAIPVTASSPTSEVQSDPRDPLIAGKKIVITKFNWYKGGFDSVMLADLRVKNENDFPVKDLAIACELFSESNTKLGEAGSVIYQTFAPHKSKSVSRVNMGFIHSQAASANCEVLAFKFAV